MNSFTRPLPHYRLWRYLPRPVSDSGFLSVIRQLQTVCLERSLVDGSFFSVDGLNTFIISHQRRLHTSRRACLEHKLKTGIEDCFCLLGVEPDCSDQELKKAYLQKAKTYHPDSSSPSADPYKFSQVKDAYKAVLEHRKGRELKEEEEEDAGIIFDIKHTAPQHRQYLEFEGVGFGTPSQRQRQYQQHRVARVTENVFQHRIQRHAAETEDAVVVRDKQQAKKAVISNAMDRIVEDLIQESMKRGDFNNLPGHGKPLAHTAHNPFVDVTTHNLNKILVNNGFAPEWIMLQSEIRKEIHQARQTLALTHTRLKEPRSPTDKKAWHAALDKFSHQISEVNIKIHKFNLIVPFLKKQKMPYSKDREVERVLSCVEQYLPENPEEHVVWDVSMSKIPSLPSLQEAVDWKQVWRDIRNVFKSSNDEKQREF
ncbi:dnaJ homolog subfamily C member 28-like [Babylonia areolata]|uniref:dnaJ homolog subfamily C member 28-like n=1 Tax=Babylonia areolata TaxID=304850 RepID=UPI003FD03541